MTNLSFTETDRFSSSTRVELSVDGDRPVLSLEINDAGEYAVLAECMGTTLSRENAVKMRDWLTAWIDRTPEEEQRDDHTLFIDHGSRPRTIPRFTRGECLPNTDVIDGDTHLNTRLDRSYERRGGVWVEEVGMTGMTSDG